MIQRQKGKELYQKDIVLQNLEPENNPVSKTLKGHFHLEVSMQKEDNKWIWWTYSIVFATSQFFLFDAFRH